MTLHDRLQRGRERSQPPERFGHISGMPETAENLAREYAISRRRPMRSRFAVTNGQRRHGPTGKFDGEVVAVTVPQKKGPPRDIRAMRAFAATPVSNPWRD